VKPHALAARQPMQQYDRAPLSDAAVIDADIADHDSGHDRLIGTEAG
jgi:hypothetical protein